MHQRKKNGKKKSLSPYELFGTEARIGGKKPHTLKRLKSAKAYHFYIRRTDLPPYVSHSSIFSVLAFFPFGGSGRTRCEADSSGALRIAAPLLFAAAGREKGVIWEASGSGERVEEGGDKVCTALCKIICSPAPLCLRVQRITNADAIYVFAMITYF